MPIAGRECGRGKGHKGACLTPEAVEKHRVVTSVYDAAHKEERRAAKAVYDAAHKEEKRAYWADPERRFRANLQRDIRRAEKTLREDS